MKKFWIKLIVFLLFSLVIPVVYLSLRFKLFSQEQKISVSIWGIIVISLVIGVLAVFIKYYIDGLKTRYSLIKQVLNGFLKVLLPIIIILLITVWFKGKAEWLLSQTNTVIEVLLVLLGSETVAVVVNPLPKWAFDNNVSGLVEITDKIFHKGGNE